MTLHDKYILIEDHLINEPIKTITDKIENYFENYLSNDINILIPDYINQSIYFNKINIEELKINIETIILNYLKQSRNNIRLFIKKGAFELSNLTKFLKKFLLKLQYINNIIKIEFGISQLNNLIISDSIILIFIEEQVITFKHDIKELLLFIQNISFQNDMFIKIIKLFGGIYKKKIINNDELPIPINIRRIQKLNNTIQYYHKINNYYKFTKEHIIELQIFKLILEYLIDIIKYNTLYEIEYTFNKIWFFILNTIQHNFDEKEELIKKISDEIINRCSIVNINTIQDVDTILKFGKYSSILIKTNFYDKYIIFITQISKSIIHFFKEDEFKLIDFIIDFMNMSIINDKQDDAVTATGIINNIKNIFIFMNKYYDKLIIRLTNKISLPLEEFNKYIQLEKYILLYLCKIRHNSSKLINKINKVIYDIETSFNNNYEFNKLSNNLLNKDISIITTTYNWNINQNEGIIDSTIVDLIKETQIGKYLKYYEIYYTQKYDNKRILNWFPHFGEINITYLNQKIKMLPIQFIIIEMFNDIDEISFQNIITSKILINYSDKFKNDILNSIIISGLFIIKNDNIILSTSNTIKNDLIEIFLHTSDYINVWDQIKQKELVYSLLEITNTIINHIIKTCPKIKSELFLLAKEQIKLFQLDEDIFNKSLKYLIEMDYIILNDDKYEKLF